MLQERTSTVLNVKMRPSERDELDRLAVALAAQTQRPVTLSDAVRYAIRTASAAVAGNGGPLPVAISHPIQGK